MPRNATTTIAVLVPVAGLAAYFYSLQDNAAICSAIPLNGTTLSLPDDPQDGDNFAFYDADGSCSSTHPIILSGQGNPVQTASAVVFVAAFSWGVATYSDAVQGWVLQSGAGAGSSGLLSLPWTAVAAGATFQPSNLQPWLAVDTSGGTQVTIEMPAEPRDGQLLLATDINGNAAVNPIRFTSAGGVTIDDPQNPGVNYAALVAFTTQGGAAMWKYQASTSKWIFFAGAAS